MGDWNDRERRADELDDEPAFGGAREYGAYGQGEYGRGYDDEGYLTPGPGGYDRSGQYRQSPGYGSSSQVGGQGYGGGYGQGYGGAGYREEMGYEREGPYRGFEHGYGGESRPDSDHDWRASERGPFGGRGPRGYQRSDERIRDEVNDRLSDDEWVDASDIEVSVDQGVVTLSGEVDSREARRQAEDIVDAVSGVRDVMNRTRVVEQKGIVDRIGDALRG